MGLSSKREKSLEAALQRAGLSVGTRLTLPMAHGDVTETSLWHLRAAGGGAVTLCLVTEVGFDSFFPPILRAVPGHLGADAAREAAGVEFPWDDGDTAGLLAFVARVAADHRA